jgi:phosphate transport system substrate-binding protein
MIKKLLILSLTLMTCSCYIEEQETATSGRLTVQGSDGYQDLTQRETSRFHDLYPQAQFTVIPSSTREAIVNMLNDSVNLILVDRAMNNEERQVYKKAQLAVQEVKIALDALVILVNADNRITNISLENLKRVLQGQISNWNLLPGSNQDGEIVVTCTGRNSGSFELIQRHLLDSTFTFFPDMILDKQADIVQQTIKSRSALGIISHACYSSIRSSADSAAVRLLSIGVVDSTNQVHDYYPYQAYIYGGEYPLHYPVYVYVRSDKSELALGFSAFIASAEGQKIILNYGLVPATQPVRLVQLTQEQL